MAARPKPSPEILEEAAEWLLRVQAGPLDPVDAVALESWAARSPAHGLAWARARKLARRLEGFSPAAAMSALDAPENPDRRAFLAKLAILLAAAPAGWGAWEAGLLDAVRFDHAARVGEIKAVRLADGSRATLNTDSAIDVAMTAERRLVRHRAGEIFVETASVRDERPFLVDVAAGRLQALGTRFAVRQSGARFRLAVQEGAVRVTPRRGAPRVVGAGRQAWFTAAGVAAPTPAPAAAFSWMTRMLVADRTPMREVAAELGRYRRGRLRVEPAAGDIPVSGAFPLTDVDAALAMLAAAYPVAVERTLFGLAATIKRR